MKVAVLSFWVNPPSKRIYLTFLKYILQWCTTQRCSVALGLLIPSNQRPINLAKSKFSGVDGSNASVTLSANVCNCSGGNTSAKVVPFEIRLVIDPNILHFLWSHSIIPIKFTTSICPWEFLGIPPGNRGIPGTLGNPACAGPFPPPPRAATKLFTALCDALCWRRTSLRLELVSPNFAKLSLSSTTDCPSILEAGCSSAVPESVPPVPRTFGIPCDRASATPA